MQMLIQLTDDNADADSTNRGANTDIAVMLMMTLVTKISKV